MKKFLLVGAAVVFAGIAATVAVASDHKPARHAAPPARATVVTPAKATPAHKGPAPRRHHHVVKRHHGHAPRAHAK